VVVTVLLMVVVVVVVVVVVMVVVVVVVEVSTPLPDTPMVSRRQTSFDVAVFENEVRWL
jgi:hypothetical protein